MGKFNVFVKTAEGHSITVEDMETCSTVMDLKQAIQAKEGHDPANIRLIFSGAELDNDGATLEDYDVMKDSSLHMVLRLQGGF